MVLTWLSRRSEELGVFLVSKSMITADYVLLVDTGGNIGHQSACLRSRYQGLPGQIIEQSFPEMIHNAPAVDAVELMAHNLCKA
jgi:hypothetical protein